MIRAGKDETEVSRLQYTAVMMLFMDEEAEEFVTSRRR